MKNTSTPLYATLLYEVRKKLEVSVAEYFYLDMVHKLSYQRWCTKSLEHCADDIGISKFGLIKLRNRLIDRGLLEKNMRGGLRVTHLYTDIAVNKVDRPPYAAVNKVAKSVNKVDPSGQQSTTKSNKRLTLDYKTGKNEKGYKAAKAARASLAKHLGQRLSERSAV